MMRVSTGSDMDVLSDAGNELGDINDLSDAGINWSDIDVI